MKAKNINRAFRSPGLPNTTDFQSVDKVIHDFANGEMYYVDVDTKKVILDILGVNENEEISLPFKNEEVLKKFL